LDLSDHINCWQIDETFITVQGDCVTDEINGIFLKAEFFEHKLGWLVGFDFFVGLWIFFFEILHGFHELLASSLFHHTHEVR
jgi:hypothetical protein